MTKKKAGGEKNQEEVYDHVVNHTYSSFGSFISDKTKNWPELLETMDILDGFTGDDEEAAEKITIAKGQLAEMMMSGLEEMSEAVSDLALKGIECRK